MEKFIPDRKSQEDAAATIDAAWRLVLFNQFHDIFAGTSIRPSYEHAYDELGSAKTTCRGIIADAVRRVAIHHPPAKEQQVVFVNMSGKDFDGCVDFAPWLGYIEREAKVDAYLVDEAGSEVPSQMTRTESAFWGFRFLVRLAIPSGGKRTLRIRRDRAGVYETGVRADDAAVSNAHVAASLDASGVSSFGEPGRASLLRAPMRVVAIEDASDTWSHRIDIYTGQVCGEFTSTSPWRQIDPGPLRAGMMNAMTLGASTLRWQVYAHADESIVRMRLRVNWNDGLKIVKLLIPLAFDIRQRIDGIPGGRLARECDGKEYPVFDYLALVGADGALAVVSRDIFSADVQPGGVARLTLLRSPHYCHHDPFTLVDDRYPLTDQGEHEYEIALMAMKELSFESIEAEAARQTKPVWIAETTNGMAERSWSM